jgi:N-methylhydantoinase B
VLCGLVSVDAARTDYGVVIDEATSPISVDAIATKQLREQMRQSRADLPMFDRGQHFRDVKEQGGLTWPQGWSDPDEWLANATS